MNKIFLLFLVVLIIEFITIPIIVKYYSMGFLILPNNETKLHLISQIIAHDSLIYLILTLLIYISYLKFINRYISSILRFISVFIFILYITDIFILKNFVTHLNINDVIKYLDYAPKYINQEYKINISQLFIFIAIFSFFVFFTIKQIELKKINHYGFILFFIICLALNSFSKDDYVHSWTYKNFLEYNFDLLAQSKPYSNELKNNIKNNDEIICVDNVGESNNIIILMVESFASYQSQYFSGIRNWTPNLDKIALNNINIKNFYSNGFITEDAEISILTGLFPIYSPTMKTKIGSTAFQGFFNIKNSLPNHLKEKGYKTEFITSADLEFSNTGSWAKSLGMDYIEGSTHSFYQDKTRYHFDAPADEYLFHRVIQRINKNKDSSPYFLFVKTVSSHIPFYNPKNGNYSEEETIKYVDEQIGIFYKNLQDLNFFKNGLLIIVGDHHPIIPLKKEQILKNGIYKAGLNVPLIVSKGEKEQKSITSNYHQVDIYNSIKNYISDKSCTSNWNGDFLTNAIPPKYIVYRRGDKRGVITILNQENNIYNLKLDGDNTDFVNKSIPLDSKKIVNKINYERIEREKNQL